MARSAREYLNLLSALLPVGRLWGALRQSGSVAQDLLRVPADELSRIDSRIDDLLTEMDPRTTRELLPEWEAFAGLPDPCTGQASSIQERRARLVQQLTDPASPTTASITEAAARIGYTITIERNRSFIAGLSRCGDSLAPPEIRHTWRIYVAGARVTRFRTGISAAGERLLTIARAEDLECLIKRRTRAHTKPFLIYEGE